MFMIAIRFLRAKIPTGGPGKPMSMYFFFPHEFPKQDLDLAARMTWQYIPELLHLRPNRFIVMDMLQQESFVCLPIQPFFPSVGSLPTSHGIKTPGKNIAGTSSSTCERVKSAFESADQNRQEVGAESVLW